jgi:DNA replicative helicase MCM subunit Mcm2 (Cdc46/Mcm family)
VDESKPLPVGSRYNSNMSVIDNIDLPPTLLSRFDLIFLVLDKANPETDRRLARHLIALHFKEEDRPKKVGPGGICLFFRPNVLCSIPPIQPMMIGLC